MCVRGLTGSTDHSSRKQKTGYTSLHAEREGANGRSNTVVRGYRGGEERPEQREICV